MARNLQLRESSGQELDQLSEISPSDAERARERWKEVAPPPYTQLADVTEEVQQREDV
jgi:hypothetical protein